MAVMALFISSLSSAQANLPDVRGVYDGMMTRTIAECTDGTTGPGTATLPVMFHIFEQAEGSFRGALYEGHTQTGLVFFGEVGPGGEVSFIFASSEFTSGEVIEDFRFGGGTGQIAGGTFTFSGNGLVGSITETEAVFCLDTFSGSATRGQSSSSSNLAITSSAAPDPVASGARLTYTQRVTNAGPDEATGVIVSEPIPEGTTFASLTTSQGSAIPPAAGAAGQATYFIGSLPVGGSATVTLTVNVLAASGQTISNTATVASLSNDSNANNNTAETNTDVSGGGVVRLVWDQLPPTPENPTPAPTNLRVEVSGPATVDSAPPGPRVAVFAPAESACMLLRVNVYKADTEPVQLIPANLWKSVPPDQLQTSMAAAPAGSFYVISNIWQCGNATVESGGSNQAAVPAGPGITKVKGSGKLKITGSGFSQPSEVFIDGVGFAKSAKVSDSGHITQKGSLSDGRSIRDAMPVGRTVIVTVRKSNGGIGSFAVTRD